MELRGVASADLADVHLEQFHLRGEPGFAEGVGVLDLFVEPRRQLEGGRIGDRARSLPTTDQAGALEPRQLLAQRRT